MATLELELLDDDNETDWDDHLRESSKGSTYHSLAWLKLLESYSGSELLLFTAMKGQQCIGLFPLFYKRRLTINTLFSPPPSLAVPHLGPVFPHNSTKQSEIESITTGFLDLILEHLRTRMNLRSFYALFHSAPHMVDMRPCIWRGFNVQPLYTYVLGLENGLESIRQGFSQSERRYLKRVERDADTSVEIGDAEDMVRVNDLVKERYLEQGIGYSVHNQYLLDLLERFPEAIFTTKLVKNGETISGMIYVKSGDTLSFWIGGTPLKKKMPGGITRLHWWGIEKARELGLRRYEVMGANTEHLSKNKSKLNPKLAMYFSISKKNLQGRMAEYLYGRFRKRRRG